MTDYERIVLAAEQILRVLLVEENYDSVHTFISFYETYKEKNLQLYDFFKTYDPPIVPKKLTCVGLAIELIKKWHQLDNDFPDFASSCFLVSCEESVDDIIEYVQDGDSPESVSRIDKEHTLVSIRVNIDGRPGILLADPGYHLPRVITVMNDGAPPNTGTVIQSTLSESHREFTYNFNIHNDKYIDWCVKKVIDNLTDTDLALIYVYRPYLEGINVTIRRNLVYELRSILARNEDGILLGGMYFRVREEKSSFTLLLPKTETETRKTRCEFDKFIKQNVPKEILQDVEICNSILHLEEGELLNIINKVAEILEDKSYIKEMLKINEYVRDYCRCRPRPVRCQ